MTIEQQVKNENENEARPEKQRLYGKDLWEAICAAICRDGRQQEKGK